MELKEIMQQQSFAVLGDTLNPQKYACQIKEKLLAAGYTVYPVGKELSSLNLINGEIDIIDLCIHPVKGLQLLQENKKHCKCVVIQPGAESEEIISFLNANKIPYINGCLLVGLSLYAKNK